MSYALASYVLRAYALAPGRFRRRAGANSNNTNAYNDDSNNSIDNKINNPARQTLSVFTALHAALAETPTPSDSEEGLGGSPAAQPLARDMGGAPRSPAPRHHTFGVDCHRCLWFDKNIVECPPLLGALPLSLTLVPSPSTPAQQ